MEAKQIKAMVSVVHMGFFHGLEGAMNAGRDIAIGDFVYEFDDIFVDYEPEVIMEVYHKLIEGNDIVAASSKGKLRLTSRVFYSLYNRTSRGKGRSGRRLLELCPGGRSTELSQWDNIFHTGKLFT